MIQCASCFDDFIAKCNDVVNVYAQLAPLTNYQWLITDKFNNQYTGDFTTNANGFWYINVAELPPGLLTEFSGEFKLEVLDASCTPIKFKVAQEYDCIQFTVEPGTRVKDNLGCPFTALGGNNGNIVTGRFDFTDEDVVTIPWTPTLLTNFGNNPTVEVFHEISPGIYQLVHVQIQQNYTGGVLTSIVITNAGTATGYVLVS